MSRLLFRRICAALLVLTFLVGLPMQGTAMVVSALASPAPWAGDAETPSPDSCDGCGTLPAMIMLCPIVFCIGLTGIFLESPEFERQLSTSYLRSISSSGVGRNFSPDPDPPRLSS